MIQPPPLKQGDLIYITSPAKLMDAKEIDYAINFFKKNGFEVLVSKHCLGQFNYFSGTDDERRKDMQVGIDHPDVRAIVCARGGYGCVRIVEQLNWANMLLEPKWLVGFSDITVFHHHLSKLGIQSIHGSMPINFEKNTQEALSTLISSLTSSPLTFSILAHTANKVGIATGKLIGGNLSIVYSMLGTNDQYNFEDAVLFLEDVGEHYYQIERMLFALSKAGVFQKLKGIIIGAFTGLEDTTPPLGKTIEEMVLEQVQFLNYPVLFNFPVGHIEDNQALIIGREVKLSVNKTDCSLDYLN